MALSAADEKKLLEFVNNRRGPNGGVCSRCKENMWSVHGPIELIVPAIPTYTPYSFGGSFVTMGIPPMVLPTAALVCGNCGLTELVNLGVAGISATKLPFYTGHAR